MRNNKRLAPIEAAHEFINKFFPHCQGALLAGSVASGDDTETSDLDIVVFDKSIGSSYRESLIEFGWPIEVFAHNLNSYKQYFESDRKRARPSLPKMVVEGNILKDDGIVIAAVKKEANELLEKGPEKWSIETINLKRYFITDVLEDFIGSKNRAEDIFIANTLAELLCEFVLRTNRQWVGASKWIIRSLRNHNQEVANEFEVAFDTFYRTGKKEPVITLVDEVLHPHGGRLFEGFSLGKRTTGQV